MPANVRGRTVDAGACATAATTATATATANWNSSAKEVMGAAAAAIGEIGRWIQLPSILANAGPARAIIATIAAATARTNFVRPIRNLLYPTLQRASLAERHTTV
ncbi:MAG TPA: hypothetical protein VFE09_04225 [Rubrobacteraceae bacterium]|nr:hypothetical protein [Rubrobacteraceae bacterium]